MRLRSLVTEPLRAVLDTVAEQTQERVEEVLPLKGVEQVQEGILETERAIRAATESIAQHVAVLETLADSLPMLTHAVENLTEQLSSIMTVLAPVAGAERRVAGIEQLFRRVPHAHDPADTPQQQQPPASD